MVKRNVRTAIEKVIREKLGKQVHSVTTTRDDAFEDDDILSVTVTLRAEATEIDPSDEMGLVRHLQPKLQAIGEEGFPLISFVPRQEEPA